MKVSTLLPVRVCAPSATLGSRMPVTLCLGYPRGIVTQIRTFTRPAKRYAKRTLSALLDSC
jgi:hypothetical protein